MGAGDRRASRRLKAAPPPGPISAPHHPALLLVTAATYAGLVGALLLAVDQAAAAAYSQAPWLQVAGAALVFGSVLSGVIFAWTAWRRRREGAAERALLWGVAGIGATLLGAMSLYVAALLVNSNSLLYGADIRLTRPVIDGLPRLPGAVLVGEYPGNVLGETINQVFRVSDLSQVAPFYRGALPGAGWKEETATVPSALPGVEVDFDKGQFVVSITMDKASGTGEFRVSVAHIPPEPPANPSPAAS